MNTPVLNTFQQKRAFSGRKKNKKTIKNVLALPYSTYWPLLKPDDESLLKDALDEYLVQIKAPSVAIPWSELKSIPREQRKAFRETYRKEKLGNVEENGKCGIVFGVNETVKLLEAGGGSSVLISADVNPQFLVKHVIDLAVLKKVPVLVVPNLKATLKAKTRICSVIVAFKDIQADSTYWLIDQKIKEIFVNYPVPPDHPNFNDENVNSTGLPAKREEEENEEEEEEESGKDSDVEDLYLYRKSTAERVFVPELSKERENLNVMQVDVGEFIAFDDEKSSNVKTDVAGAKRAKVSYKSLVVKRVQNNENREKRKVEILKKSK